MKTNPYDKTVPELELNRDGTYKNNGLTKLEHFASMIMQTKLAVAMQSVHGATQEGHLKLIAQHSVREAMVLIEALNEYDTMLDNSKKSNRTYTAEFPLSEILGINTEGTVPEPSITFSPDINTGIVKGDGTEDKNPMGEDYEHSPSGDL